MDAETWGGEVAIVTCPKCRAVTHKARTQRYSALWCPCGQVVVVSDNYTIRTEVLDEAGLERRHS